eukprot:Clim_evm28s141 gene=Clim_evmTU28s141
MRLLVKFRFWAPVVVGAMLYLLHLLSRSSAMVNIASLPIGAADPPSAPLCAMSPTAAATPPIEAQEVVWSDLPPLTFHSVVFMAGVDASEQELMTATYGFMLREEGIDLKFVDTTRDHAVQQALQEAYEVAVRPDWYILMERSVIIDPKVLRTLLNKTHTGIDVLYGKECCTPFSSGTMILGTSVVRSLAEREIRSLQELQLSSEYHMAKDLLLAPGIPLWSDAFPPRLAKFIYTSLRDVEGYFWRVHSSTEQRREGYYNLPVGDRVAIVLTTFNMPERTAEIHNYLKTEVDWPIDIIIVDNGCEPEHAYEDATVKLQHNVQTNHGWMMGVAYAEAMASMRREAYLGIVLTITSAKVEEGQGDIIAEMAKILKSDKSVAGVHPALTKASTTQWDNLITEYDAPGPTRAKSRESYPPRTTWMIDNIFAMWRGDWYFRYGRFDPLLTYAWGVDVETSFITKVFNMKVVVLESILVSKETDVGYKMNRMGMQKNDRRLNAREEVCTVYGARFGPDIWRSQFFSGIPYLKDHWKKQCEKLLNEV